ncbi:hypothetical protein K438DRAFT_1769020 [Mycena galopus ATCC 62051]|nr:hypothetical protein K438DRAFT_1769020 [Mycena galopus ATCC 62051]
MARNSTQMMAGNMETLYTWRLPMGALRLQACCWCGVNLQSGAYVDRTALQAASLAGHIEIVHPLLNHGVELNGESANALPAASGVRPHIDIMGLLLDRGADVNGRDEQGANALLGIPTVTIIHRNTAPQQLYTITDSTVSYTVRTRKVTVRIRYLRAVNSS